MSNNPGSFNYNVGIGNWALRYNVTGDNNVAIGRVSQMGISGKSHSNNTSVGYESLKYIVGSDSVGIGSEAGLHATGSYNTFVGSEAGKG